MLLSLNKPLLQLCLTFLPPPSSTSVSAICWQEPGTFSVLVSERKVTPTVADLNITDLKHCKPQEGYFSYTLDLFRLELVLLFDTSTITGCGFYVLLCVFFFSHFRTEHPVLPEKVTALLQHWVCFDLRHLIFEEQILPFCSYQSRL